MSHRRHDFPDKEKLLSIQTAQEFFPDGGLPLAGLPTRATHEESSELTLKIGSIVFTIESRTSNIAQIIHKHFSHCLGNPEESSLRLICDSKDRPGLNSSNTRVENPIERRSSYWVLRSKDFEATYFPRYRMAWASIPENIHCISQLLQMLFTLWLEKRQGMLIEGLTVLHKEWSYIFLDVAKADCDSLTAIPRPGLLLQGELSLVAFSPEGGYIASQAPLGHHSSVEGQMIEAPLAGIFFLSEAHFDEVRSLHGDLAVPKVMNHVFSFTQEPACVEALTGNVRRLANTVPLHEISSVGHSHTWEFLERQHLIRPLLKEA